MTHYCQASQHSDNHANCNGYTVRANHNPCLVCFRCALIEKKEMEMCITFFLTKAKLFFFQFLKLKEFYFVL